MFVWHASLPCEWYLLKDIDTSWTIPHQGISFINDDKIISYMFMVTQELPTD